MTESSLAPMRTWLAAPMDPDVSEAIERLRHAPDVQQVAVMPDVHLGADVCIGVVVATSHSDLSAGCRRRHRLRHAGGRLGRGHHRARRS